MLWKCHFGDAFRSSEPRFSTVFPVGTDRLFPVVLHFVAARGWRGLDKTRRYV